MARSLEKPGASPPSGYMRLQYHQDQVLDVENLIPRCHLNTLYRLFCQLTQKQFLQSLYCVVQVRPLGVSFKRITRPGTGHHNQSRLNDGCSPSTERLNEPCNRERYPFTRGWVCHLVQSATHTLCEVMTTDMISPPSSLSLFLSPTSCPLSFWSRRRSLSIEHPRWA